jgi:hypothetical protein
MCAFALACGTGDDDSTGTEVTFSNGAEVMDGVDAAGVTTLAGNCTIRADEGRIDCDELVVRLNTAGVYENIGWEVVPPAASMCAGSDVPAPSVAVFSFGSLVVPDGSQLHIEGSHAVALVAARSIEIHGEVAGAAGRTGGFPSLGSAPLLPDPFEPIEFGPSPGGDVSGEGKQGGGGAGGSTVGGAGGNAGGAGGPAIVGQFEPLCGGSGGGTVADYTPGGGGVIYGDGGGRGGAALLLAANDSIAIDGGFGCGVFAFGLYGSGSDRSGPGGGSGGTLSLESPSVTIGGECELSAIGGFGASSPSGALGGAPGDGTNNPEDGAGGDLGGGGGGAAGFIRIRTDACPVDDTGIVPPATCEPLP